MITITPQDLAMARRAGVVNGCGPASWRVHTWRWWVARLLMPGLETYCEIHDLRYWLGGTDGSTDASVLPQADDRYQADVELRDGILDHARRSSRLGHWLLEGEAPEVFRIVRAEGSVHFHHGRPRTLADLYAVAAAKAA